MKLFTKDIDQKLFDQYIMGNDLENQMAVAKIFNPYGNGVWYLLNSDPSDPDYLWAIVDLFEVEVGSVSREELETLKVPPFRLGLERDLYFTPMNAKKLYEALLSGEKFEDGGTIDIKKDKSGESWVFPNNPQGETYGIKLAAGGMTAGRWYKDNSGQEFRYIGESQGKLLFKDGEKVVYKQESDFEEAPQEKKRFSFFEDGGMMAKGGSVNSIEKRVAEVNELIKRGNELGIEVVDSSTTWQAPMKFKPLKYTNGVLYVEYEELDLYANNKGMGRNWETKKYKVTKYESAYGGKGEDAGTMQKSVLSDIAKMYRKPLKSYDTYGYFKDGGESQSKRYKVNVYYGGEMEDEEFYTDSLDEAERASQGGEHSEIYDNHKKEFVEIEYASGGFTSSFSGTTDRRRVTMADGGIINLESVGTYLRTSDMTTSPSEDFKNDGEINWVYENSDEWWNALSEKDRNTIGEHNRIHFKRTMMAGDSPDSRMTTMAKGGKLPETIGGYKIDFSKWREDVIATIEVEPNSAPFEPFYLKGVGKTEKQAFQNLEKEYNSMKKSSYVVTFSIDDSGWIKSKPISAYTEEQASNILYESASMEGDVSILKIDKISMADGGELTPAQIKAKSYRVASPSETRQKKKSDRALIKEEIKKIPKNEMKAIEAFMDNEDLLYPATMADGGVTKPRLDCVCTKTIKFTNGMNYFEKFTYGCTENHRGDGVSVSYEDGRFTTMSKEIFNKHFEYVNKMAKGGISKDSTWYQANYKLQNGLDSSMNFPAKSDREAIKLANNQLKRPNAELLNIYLVKGDKYTIVYGDSWESIRDTPEISKKNTMADGGEVNDEDARLFFNKGLIDEIYAKDFVIKLNKKGIKATKRASKNGVFIYGEKGENGKYKYETYLSYSELPNNEFLELEESEFLRMHKKMADGGQTYSNYEMVLIATELEKDGGYKHKFRYLVSAKDINEAKNIVTEMWDDEMSNSDLSIVNVISDEEYRLNYMGKMAKGGGVGFTPYGETKGIYKVYYKADGKPQTEIWETKEMAVNTAKRYSSPQMAEEFSNVKVFDEEGAEVDYMSEDKYAKGGKLKIGGDDFSFLLELSDNELSQRLDLVRKQQNINGEQYFAALNKKESTQKIEYSGEKLANQERAIIEARLIKYEERHKMADGGMMAKGGAVEPNLVKFNSMYDGTVDAYESVEQKGTYFYVGGDKGQYVVTVESEGFPATEAFDDWMYDYADALDIAKKLAMGEDFNEYAKGGELTDAKKEAILRKKGNIILFKEVLEPTNEGRKSIAVTGFIKDRKSGGVKIEGRAYDTQWFDSMQDLINAVDWSKWEGNKYAKGGYIKKGKKFISHLRNQSGEKITDIVEIIDTDAVSERIGYKGKVVKYKIIDSSDKKRIGIVKEDPKGNIYGIYLKYNLWEKYDNDGIMAKGGEIEEDVYNAYVIWIDDNDEAFFDGGWNSIEDAEDRISDIYYEEEENPKYSVFAVEYDEDYFENKNWDITRLKSYRPYGRKEEMMANGGELMKHKHNESITIELIEPTSKGWKVKQIETHSVRGRKLSTPKEKVAYFSKEEIKDLFEPTMAKGGMTKFKDKVQSIKASLLKRKKVSPKVQKDYGKTYSPKEAEESAKRIVGSMVKKEKRQPRVSKILEKMKKGTQLNKKKSTFKDRMKELSNKIKEKKNKTTK